MKHTKNIVIKLHCCQPKYIAQITDFGGAILMNDKHDDFEDIGQIAFTDPKRLNYLGTGKYKKNLSSDIYSVGVIFWEISSNKIPFESYMPGVDDNLRDLSLTLDIICGYRETSTSSTPEDYSSLYQNCWVFEPNDRPNITTIIENLNIMTFPEVNESIGLEILGSGKYKIFCPIIY